MINGLGVVGWGVGGIEAEAGMLGQPVYLLTPEVVGVAAHRRAAKAVTATDLVLTVTELRACKAGWSASSWSSSAAALESMSLTDRATIANMAPEYGATMGFFPVDDETLTTFKPHRADQIGRAYCVERYYESARTIPHPKNATIDYSQRVISWISAPLCPRWPDPSGRRTAIAFSNVKKDKFNALSAPSPNAAFARMPRHSGAKRVGPYRRHARSASATAVVIAAITSCTNTSIPRSCSPPGCSRQSGRDGADRPGAT